MLHLFVQTAIGVATFWLVYCSWSLYRYFSKPDDPHEILDRNKDKDTVIVIGHQLSQKSILKSLVSDSEDCISLKTYEDFSRKLQEIKRKYGEEKEISIYLHTPGGSLFYSQLISNLIYHWKGQVTAIIIGYAASGGTLIALSCDQIVMTQDSVLGPIDPLSIKDVSGKSTSLQYAEEIFNEATDEEITNKNFGVFHLKKDVERTMPVYREFLTRMLSKNYSEEKTQELINFFLRNRAHSMPIFVDECQKIGLNVQIKEA